MTHTRRRRRRTGFQFLCALYNQSVVVALKRG